MNTQDFMNTQDSTQYQTLKEILQLEGQITIDLCLKWNIFKLSGGGCYQVKIMEIKITTYDTTNDNMTAQ